MAHLREHPGFRLVRTDVTDYIHVGGPVAADDVVPLRPGRTTVA